MKIIVELFKEYQSQIIALVVGSVSVTVVYQWLVSIFYLKSFDIPRFVVAVLVLLMIWAGIRYKRLAEKLDSYERPKLTEEMEYVLWMHKDVSIGNGQCASTLIEGQDSLHIQHAQYCLDELYQKGFLRVINNPDPDEEERLYVLTEPGRRYLVETGLLYKDYSDDKSHNKKLKPTIFTLLAKKLRLS